MLKCVYVYFFEYNYFRSPRSPRQNILNSPRSTTANAGSMRVPRRSNIATTNSGTYASPRQQHPQQQQQQQQQSHNQYQAPPVAPVNGYMSHNQNNGAALPPPVVHPHYTPSGLDGGPIDDLPQQHAGGTQAWNHDQQDSRNATPVEWGQPSKYDQYVQQPQELQQQQVPQQQQQQQQQNYSYGAQITNQIVQQSYGVPCWYYVDPQGNGQGPFDDLQMRQWYQNGFFTADLKMKRGVDNVYVILGDIFSNLEQDAFQPGFGPCPSV